VKNNRLFKKYGLIMSLIGLMLVLSGCIAQTSEVNFKLDNPLSASQKIYVQYSDGVDPEIYTSTQTEFTFPTKADKWIVGFYVSDGEYSWVPQYSYSDNTPVIINFSDIEENKPDYPAASAVLLSTNSSDPDYVSVTYAVYGSDGNLAVNGQTAVFAHSDESTIFYDNDPLSSSSTKEVNEGFLSYTQKGLVTFVIRKDSVTDISSMPLELYSGSKQIYNSLSNKLSALSLSSGELTPKFDAEQTVYSTTVDNNVSSVTVTPTAAGENASVTVSVNDSPAVSVSSGQASEALALRVGNNNLVVTVTAQNGATNTYTVTVSRAASANVDLSGLSLSEGVLNADFAPGIISYSTSVANSVSSLTVTPTAADTNASVIVSINDSPAVSVSSGHASEALALNVGDNNLVVTVTAQNNTTTKTYTITATRAASIPSSPIDIDKPTAPSKVTSTNGQLTVAVNIEGEVSLNNEVSVSIPVGASLKELKLTISKVMNTEQLLTIDQVSASPVFEILKNFTENFRKPVTLSFVFDQASIKNNQTAAVHFYDETNKTWVKIEGGKIVGNRIEVGVDHFTKFAVLAVDAAMETLPTEPETLINFNDISKHWAEESIKVAVNEGIVTGYPDGTFKPGNKVTRAEFVVMLINTLKLDNEGAELTFTDTSKIGAWARRPVALAVEAGIINGYQDGSFRPNAVITRAEMAAMIALALDLPSETNAVIGFADDKDIPLWARNAVGAIKELNLVSGNPANEYMPNSPTSRAEAVTVLVKVLALKSK